jgi:hypothetical protein
MALGMAKLKPWIGSMWGKDAQGKNCGCALAAVYAGYGAKWGDEDPQIESKLLPGSVTVKQQADWGKYRACPVCSDKGPCNWMLAHLNDDHEWSRDACRDWLISIAL